MMLGAWYRYIEHIVFPSRSIKENGLQESWLLKKNNRTLGTLQGMYCADDHLFIFLISWYFCIWCRISASWALKGVTTATISWIGFYRSFPNYLSPAPANRQWLPLQPGWGGFLFSGAAVTVDVYISFRGEGLVFYFVTFLGSNLPW